MRSASACTCCFSRETLMTRSPSRAWRKNVRWPGGPTVPATKRSGGSKAWTSGGMPDHPRTCWPRARTAADRRASDVRRRLASWRAG